MENRQKQFVDISEDSRQEIAVQPGGELLITGATLDDITVDIVDTDIILANPETDERVVLLGLAIFLFDDEEVPLISIGGEVISPNVLLSKVGEVDNLTMQEFVAVSSLLHGRLEKSEEEKEEAEADNESEQSIEIIEALMEAIQAVSEAQTAVEVNVKASEETGKYDKKWIDEEGDTFLVNDFTARPVSPALAAASEAPLTPEPETLFELFLLQPTRSEGVELVNGLNTRSIRGGGGSEESGFNPDNEAQFSTEVLNFGTASEDLIIRTDDPALFDANTMSRVIELNPTLPAGFEIVEIKMTGFPLGFDIEGGNKVGQTWTVDSPSFNDRGAVRLNLSYDVPSDDTFRVEFSVTSRFQAGSVDEEGKAIGTPPERTLLSEDSREFVVREVLSAADLNYVNSNGDEVWVLAVSPNPNRVFSGSGDDQIFGSTGIDFVQGGDGNDTLDGGAGNDTLNGEEGDDRFIHSEGLDRLIGGAGADTADYSSVDTPMNADLSSEFNGFTNVVINVDDSDSEFDEINTIENITTGSGDDTLVGNAEDNHLAGSGGRDILTGGGGHDILDGGDDIDIADYRSSAGPIVTNLELDIDNVFIDESNIDTLINIEEVIGSEFDDVLGGSAGDDSFAGGLGDDRLIGGEGSDVLDGGEGDHDVADFSNISQGVRVDLGGAEDSQGYIVATHGNNADQLKNIEDLAGSSHDDELRGSEENQSIYGGEGDDTIDGAAGDDQLDGGPGTDDVAGGAGDDIFVYSDGGDTLDGSEDLDTLDLSFTPVISQVAARLDGSNDSTIDVTGGDNFTVRNIENIVGTAGNDRLQGDDRDNILDGADGNDILIGAAGNDSLIGGNGRDSADYSVAEISVTIDLSAGEVTSDGFGGRDAISGIEDLTGSDFDDFLAGDSQDNVLTGGLGDDVLVGQAGDDFLVGGEGQDAASYEFSASAVRIDLASDEPTRDGEGGSDTFDSIESAIGSAFDDELSGDEQDNILSGLGGDDILDGREGQDTLSGGAGNDILLPSLGSDSFDGGTGSDILDYSTFSPALAISVRLNGDIYAPVLVEGSDDDQVRNIETIVGTAGDDVIGGGFLNNTLIGEAGDDVLFGGTGSDTLDGGAGDDQLRFDDLSAGGVTLSLVTNTAAYSPDGSTDIFSGFERYATTNQSDIIFTSERADIVESLGADDHFHTSAGSDSLFGGSGQDIVDYSLHEDIDHIEATLDEGNMITVTVVGGDNDQITDIEGIIGSSGDDLLIGDTQDNELRGDAGDDYFEGLAGDDLLFGDAGQDRFLGGMGSDAFDGGAGIDVIDYSYATGGVAVDLSLNTAINDGFGGQDSIVNVENIIGTDDVDILTGDGRANALTGSEGDDIIRGGIGSDRLDGGSGDFDEVHFDDLIDFGITLDLGTGTAFYSGDASTDELFGFEEFYTTNLGDLIRGSAGADTVFGMAGEDLFMASTGADRLVGGSGVDSIDYSAESEALAVNVTLDGENEVTVQIDGIGEQVIASIENVKGTAGEDYLGGDENDNVLSSGAGNDTVFGGAGSDELDGGSGTDELRFDDLGAVGIVLNLSMGTADYAADASTDTFTAFERFLTTQQNDTVNTSDSADTLFTLAGDDTVKASLGADNLDGGLGVDVVDYSGLVGVSGINVLLDGSQPVEVAVDGAENDIISSFENIIGTSGADRIEGDAEQNIFDGLAGNDVLAGHDGNDELLGGQGDDLLSGGDGNDVLDGEQGRDTASYVDASGGVAVDLSIGETTNDGYGGSDILRNIENVQGSVHADLLQGDDRGNQLDGGAGDDVVYGGEGSDTLFGGDHVVADVLRFDDLLGSGIELDLSAGQAVFAGDLSVDTFSGFERYIGTRQSDILDGSVLSDVVSLLAGDDLFNASAGTDTFDGGAGTDTLNYSELTAVDSVSVVLNGNNSVMVNVEGGDNDFIVNIENIIGSSGDDAISGDSFDNKLTGLEGADYFGASDGADIFSGGEGRDTLDYSGFASASSISVTLQGDELTTVSIVGSDSDTVSGIENFIGTAGNDQITGDANENELSGKGGDDILDGGDGNDTILGGAGADLIVASEGEDTHIGGSGIDTIDYSGRADGQSIDVTLDSATAATVNIANAENHTISEIENVIGTDGDDQITGDDQQNRLKGRDGDDALGASLGADVLDGGAGSDTADYSSVNVQRISIALDGDRQTTVQVSGADDDALVRIENVIGTSGNDTLVGDSLNNRLEGRGGDDVLVGNAGDDTLDGGTGGVDSVSYTDATNGINVDLSAGLAIEDGFGGVDTLIDIEQLTASDHDDQVSTGALTQQVLAGDGDDRINLSPGAITVDGGAGSDTADYSALPVENAISVELDGLNSVSLTVVGSASQTLTSVENLVGSQGDDILIGDSNDNRLEGGLGNDTLQGQGGDDALIGGEGIDIADYSQAGAPVTASLLASTTSDDGEGGTDSLSGIENISGSVFNDTLTGDANNNRLLGNSGNDTLDGGEGDDTIFGGAGADVILGSEGADNTTGGSGLDTIDFSNHANGQTIAVTLNGAIPAVVAITGADNQTISEVENVIGTGGDDQIIGDDQQNRLEGGDGDDYLGASGGADVLDGGTGSDTADFSTAGAQRISVALDEDSQVTVQVSGGADDVLVRIENIIGTEGNDTLAGDSLNNTLEGRSGDDVLVGNTGNDILDGGVGGKDSVSYSDAIEGVTVDLSAGLATEDGFGGVDTLIDIEQLTASDHNDLVSTDADTQQVLAGDGDDRINMSLGAINVDGGAGSDTASYSALSAGNAVTVELDGLNSVTATVAGSDSQTLTAVENLVGSQGDDTLIGDNNNNRLDGGLGNDRLQGQGGNDELIGGDGVDIADYSQAGAAVTSSLLVNATSDDGEGGSDSLSGIENLSGSVFDDRLTGDASNNSLLGNSGDDTLDGGDGDDTILGGAGADFILSSEGADTTTGGSGVDTIDFSNRIDGQTIDVSLNGASTAVVAITGADNQTINEVENVIGTSGADQITGDRQQNRLEGREGDDSLGASDGADMLDGGAGSDTADYSAVGVQRISVALDGDSQTTVQVSGGDDDAIVRIENIIGTEGNDTLAGDSLNNSLEGRGGDDVLVGNAGNDTLDGGVGGIDRVSYRDATNGVVVDLSAGLASEDGFGGVDTLIDIEQLTASDHDDRVSTDAGTQQVLAGDGDDQINMSVGAINVDGGAGSDTANYSALSAGNAVSVELDGLNSVTLTVAGSDAQILTAVENLVGSQGDDTLIGDNNNNRLEGGLGNDRLQGQGGDDELIGGDGVDIADYSQAGAPVISSLLANITTDDGEGGSDSLSGIENLSGSVFGDTLIGDTSDNTLSGNGGDDTLDGGEGDDTVVGGAGADLIVGSEGADTITGGTGIDTVDYSNRAAGQTIDVSLNGEASSIVSITGAADQSISDIENIVGAGGDDQITGDDRQNRLEGGDGDDSLGASGGADLLDGGAGSDTVDYSVAAVQRINVALDEDNQVTAQVSGGDDDVLVRIENIIGTAGNDTLAGDSLNNTLEGRAGDDVLVGNAGDDTLDGGTGGIDSVSYSEAPAGITVDLSAGLATEDGFGGVDTLIDIEQLTASDHNDQLSTGAQTQQVFAGGGDDQINMTLGAINVDGGAGSDTADYSSLSAGNAVSVELDGLNSVTATVAGSDSQQLTSIENLVGSQGDDTLIGDNNNNRLDGGLGNDRLQGQGGNDELIGGDGVDIADYSQAGAAVTSSLLVNATSDDGEGGSDSLSGIENLSGSVFNDRLTGDTSNNSLLGNSGDDILSGSSGNDNLDGGAGQDLADYSGVPNAVSVDLGNQEASDDGLNGSDVLLRIENVLGTDHDDTLIGDSGNNNLQGGEGNDVLRGAAGVDTLDGGAGTADWADYSQASEQIVVDLGINSALNDGDTSIDVLNNIENVQGSDYNDTIAGDFRSNQLLGGQGDDTLIGAGGSDTLDGGEGENDAVDYQAAPNAINVNLSTNSASNDGYLSADTLSGIEHVVGSGHDDVVVGDALANQLSGGAGDDLLSGAAGIDLLDGGDGVDTASYSGASAGITVAMAFNTTSDDGDGASDTLNDIENIIGSDYVDILSGDAENNRLDGGEGDDILSGGAGQDVLIGGLGINEANYSQASSSVNVNLTSLQASIDGSGSSDTLQQIQNVTGSIYDDTLSGDAADNVLSGGNRDDLLEGRGGDDTLDGGAGSDTIVYSQANAAVHVDLSLNRTIDDGDGGEDTLLGIENVQGSAEADLLIGDASSNTIFGDAGDDRIAGRAGDDVLSGGGGIDTVSYVDAANGVIASLADGVANNDGDAGTDQLTDIENLTGSANNDILEGSSGSNVLIGGAGDDVLTGLSGADQIDGGLGVNRVTYTGSTAAVVVDLTLGQATDDGYGFVDILTNIANVTGSSNNDLLSGDANDNELLGNSGNDLLIATQGVDILDGNAGIDTADYSQLAGITGVSIALNGTLDVQAFVQGGDNDTLRNIENITGSLAADVLDGDSQVNTIIGGDGDDVIRGGSGSDVLDGGAHSTGDQLRFDDLNGVGVSLDLVNNQATYSADGSTDNFTGFESYVLSEQNDNLLGSANADFVSGLDGDDVFTASHGTDTLDGGLGSDIIDYSTLSGISAIETALTGSVASTVQVVGGSDDIISNVENVIATDGNDTLTGDDEDNNFQGRAGDDTLNGGDGTDVLSGGAGDDTFIASAGENTYSGGDNTDTVDYSQLTGVTSIEATLSGVSTTTITVNGGSADFANSVENIIGTAGNDTLIGDSFSNRLDGNDGDDLLEGRGGADTLIGGLGVDTIQYTGFSQGISLSLNGNTPVTVDVTGSGTDLVSEVENVIGSLGDDLIIGDNLVNVLEGSQGNDTFVGGGGADTLKGDEGFDTVDYSQEVGINFVSVQLNAGNVVTVSVDGGDDDTMEAIENVIGTEGDDTLRGGGSINVIDGRGGDDFISGGLSDDTLDGGAGTNTLSYSDTNSSITADMNDVTGGFFSVNLASGEVDSVANFTNIIGGGVSDLIDGDAQDNILRGELGQDVLNGAAGNDELYGGGNDDVLDGGVGDDILDGGEGIDRLVGGDGNDSINGGSGQDTIIAGNGNDVIDGGAGSDLIDYSVHGGATAISVTLNAGNDATVTVTGSDADTIRNIEFIRGTSGADTLIGDTRSNVFWGGAGDDTLNGGLGTNRVDGGSGADLFFGSAGQNTYYGGIDIDTVDYSAMVGINFVDVNLDGSSLSVAAIDGATNDLLADIENAIGTAGDDTLYGDDEVNILRGLAGDDELAGGAGVDVLDGGDDVDTITYEDASAGANIDLDANAASDDGDGATDVLIGFENVQGSDFDDVIRGDAAANQLSGGLGDDTFLGSSGIDALNGEDGTDTLDYSSQVGVTAVSVTLAGSALTEVIVTGDDNDQIRNIENLIGASGDDYLRGDDLPNYLQGGDGDDVLSGRGGNNILDGGNGTDTLLYEESALPIVADMSTAINGAFTVAIGSSGQSDQAMNISNITGGLVNDIFTGDATNNAFRGGSGNDTLVGQGGDDQLFGDAGADNLTGGEGDDYLSGGGSSDRLDGGAGDDYLDGDAGNDVFYDDTGSDTYDGGSGGDVVDYRGLTGVTSIDVVLNVNTFTTITVNGGDDDQVRSIESVFGTEGDDSFVGDTAGNGFYGVGGDDMFIGSTGADYFNGGSGQNTLDHSSLTDTVDTVMNRTAGESYTVFTATGNDTLVNVTSLLTGSGDDVIVTGFSTVLVETNAGDDFITVPYAGATINSGVGDDEIEIEANATIDTGDGDDIVTVSDGAVITADGGDGVDFFNVLGNGVDVDGGLGIDTLSYSTVYDAGVSVVLNDAGDSTGQVAGLLEDTLSGIENIETTILADTITTNSAANTIVANAGDDVIVGSTGADSIDGGSGSDVVDYSGFAATQSINVALDEDNPATVTINGEDDQTLRDVENIVGTSGNDVISGDRRANNFQAGAGDDVVYGSSGTDVLNGGDGDADVLDFSLHPFSVSFNFTTSTAFDSDGSFTQFSNFEQFILSSDDDLIRGSSADEILNGGGGDDYFYASGGADVLDGGLDNDTLDFSEYSIASISIAIDGDTQITVNVSGGDNQLVSGFENVIGSAGSDVITGDLLDNILDGFIGDDTLEGAEGDDTIRGGAGNDVLIAGAGIDSFDGGEGEDTLDYSALAGITGITLSLNTSNQVTATVGNGDDDTVVNVENVVGSDADDALTGDSSANTLVGGSGNDQLAGQAGNDVLEGDAGDDSLQGGEGNDILRGGDGVDTLVGDAGQDTLEGGAGIDSLSGGEGDDILDGGVGDDQLLGGAGNDTLNAGDGNDVFDGGIGVDTVNYSAQASASSISLTLDESNIVTVTVGGDDNDTLQDVENVVGSAGDDSITGDLLANTLAGGEGNDVLSGGGGNDVLEGGGGNDQLTGGIGNDNLTGADGDDTFYAGDGIDTINGGNDLDTIDYSGHGSASAVSVTLDGANSVAVTVSGADDDFIRFVENVTGTGGDDSLTGDGADNVLLGGAGNDQLSGRDGVDTVSGGAGDDTLDGGAGDDVLTGGSGNDFITASSGADAIDGGADTDTVDFSNLTGVSGVSVTLNGATSVVAIVSGGSNNTLASVESIIGTAGSDILAGDSQDNNFSGAAGDDVLSGGAGTDVLIGGTGNDTLSGGDGIDTLSGGAGNDTVDGGAGDDTLTGNEGDDLFVASQGADSIDGGSDSDTVDYSSLSGISGVTVSLDGNNSVPAVVAGGTNDTLVNIESIIGSGSADALTGDSMNNTLSGSGGNDVLSGGAGQDILDGGSGLDDIDGGAGNDQLQGGLSDDQLTGGAGDDSVSGGDGADLLIAGEGIDNYDGGADSDTLDYSLHATASNIDVTLNGANVVNVTVSGADNDTVQNVENVTGTSGVDAIVGDSQDNTFIAGSGNDVLVGGGGNDDLQGDAGDDFLDGGQGADTIDGGTGQDTLDYSTLTGTTGVALTLDGDVAAVATVAGGDNDSVVRVENLIGSTGDDVFIGDANNNSLSGGAGNDELSGVSGTNTLSGGAGDDVLRGGVGTDVVNAGNDSDTIYASAGNDMIDGGAGRDLVDYSGLAGVTGITATLNGATSISVGVAGGDTDTLVNVEDISGSVGNDVLTGDSADNVLSGNAGDDTLRGGAGSDQLIGGTGSDDLFGDTGNDTLNAGDGDDTLDGGAGNDAVIGGADNDTMLASAGTDAFDGGTGIDVVDYSTLTGTGGVTVALNSVSVVTATVLGGTNDSMVNVENLIGTDASDSFTGDSQANTFVGGAGDDTLSGAGGNDALQGDAGDDVLSGGAGNDTLDGGAGSDQLLGGLGADVIDGGDDIDTLDYSSHASATSISVTLNGSSDATVTIVGDSNDTVREVENVIGSGGDDVVAGDTVDNVISGHTGSDQLAGGAGNDQLFGDEGNDTLDGDDGNDTLVGGQGTDTLRGGVGVDSLSGGDGDDSLDGGAGDDIVDGGQGDDQIVGGAGSDTIDGGDDVDTLDYSLHPTATSVSVDLNGTSAVPVVLSGADNHLISSVENVSGGSGNDVIIGDSENNVLVGNGGDDQLTGDQGDDRLEGGDGIDTLSGDDGADVLIGGDGNDSLDGGSGSDTLTGGAGDDDLVGGIGMDVLNGGADNDWFDGGGGSDTINGGDGSDTASYGSSANAVTGGLLRDTGGTLEQGIDTDTVSSIETFELSAQDDMLNLDMDALAHVTVDAAAGDDSIALVDTLSGDNLTDAGIDGIDLASVFSDVETLDFTSTDLTGADTFDIGNADISSITGGGNTLSIEVDATLIALTDIVVSAQSGATVSGDSTVGSTRTVDWDNGVQLIVNS
ncbi:MAG: beta strand repeat-containing protein [Granulosicoccus sp.]